MVLGKLPVPGRPTIWITVGQRHTALAVGANGGCLIFFMPPTSKKLRGHIGLGLSVCSSVRLSVTPYVGCKTREPLELGT